MGNINSDTASTTGLGTTQISDGTNAVSIETAGADDQSNTSNRVPVNARLQVFDGTDWDRMLGGKTGAQTSAEGFPNVMETNKYNATPLALSDTNLAEGQCDSRGAKLVNPGVLGGAVTQTPVTVSTSSVTLLSANTNRCSLYIQNQGNNNDPMWVEFSATAALGDNNCVKIVPGGDFSALRDLGYVPTSEIRGIASSTSVACHVIEATAT